MAFKNISLIIIPTKVISTYVIFYCCSNPKIPSPANKYLLKVVAETLRANSRDCASLLTTCSISKTFFKCFLVHYEHVFVYCDVFAVRISFSMYLLSILNRFPTLSSFICYQFCIESRRSHQRCSLRKGLL